MQVTYIVYSMDAAGRMMVWTDAGLSSDYTKATAYADRAAALIRAAILAGRPEHRGLEFFASV